MCHQAVLLHSNTLIKDGYQLNFMRFGMIQVRYSWNFVVLCTDKRENRVTYARNAVMLMLMFYVKQKDRVHNWL